MIEVLAGIISGIISGTGMGGGTILILILSAFMKIDQHISQAANLIFFTPTAISAILVAKSEKIIDWNLGINVAIFGIIGAIIGAKISNELDIKKLKLYFGIFLSLITIYEIYSIIKQYILTKKTNNNSK